MRKKTVTFDIKSTSKSVTDLAPKWGLFIQNQKGALKILILCGFGLDVSYQIW